MKSPLADLHVHYAGSLRATHIADRVTSRSINWAAYEHGFDLAYGRPAGIRALIRRLRAGDPSAKHDWETLYHFTDQDAGSFARFSAKYALPVLAGADPVASSHQGTDLAENLAADMAAIAADAVRQGIAWVELRVQVGGKRHQTVVDQLTRLATACQDHSTADLTLCLCPSLPRSAPEHAWPAIAEVTLSALGEWIVGVDFAHVEEGHPPGELQGFCSTLHAFNAAHPKRALALLVHVGESYRDKTLTSAIRWCHDAAKLGAHRLGHALALGIDPAHHGLEPRHESVRERRAQIAYDLMHADGLRAAGVRVDHHALEREAASLAQRPGDHGITCQPSADHYAQIRCRQRFTMQAIASQGCVIETCPTSNRRIAGITTASHHPLAAFLAAGLKVVVASDDPGLLDTTLTDELAQAAAWSGMPDTTFVSQAWQARSPLLSGRWNHQDDTINQH